jgi:hydroxymethylpyrimidine/phosphomethylpyrimidine kinase
MHGRVLIIAGSDSGGAAGLQADMKTVSALWGYAATAVTALTAQNTLGVFGVQSVPADFIRLQIEVVLDDIGADCLKTGMLHLPEVIETVIRVCQSKGGDIPLVVDPVMVAKGGDRLLDPSAEEALKKLLLPQASIITPNLPEAEALTGIRIENTSHMRKAAELLYQMGPQAVLIKGGHRKEEMVTNVLLNRDGIKLYEHGRISQKKVHGTGDSLASAIAVGLAQRMPLRDAVARAFHYVHQAIEHAPALGKGFGPLNHFYLFHALNKEERRKYGNL